MKVTTVNILSLDILKEASAICFTSNGMIRKDGRLVMGAGVAKAFRDKFDGLDFDAAQAVKKNGNICQLVVGIETIDGIKINIVSFPTKHHWKDKSDIKLIEKSAIELIGMADRFEWKNIYLPAPGVSNGGLDWEKEVKPLLVKILDDRFTITFYRGK